MNYYSSTHSNAEILPRQKSDSFEPCSELCIDRLHLLISDIIWSKFFITYQLVHRIKLDLILLKFI